MDNAGSWDPLAEHMPDDFSILAIDLPGNGFSSHLPPFQNYYVDDTVALIRRLKHHFKWEKVNLLGHSGGSAPCYLYVMVFPEDVKSFFSVDYLIDFHDTEDKIASLADFIDRRIELGLLDQGSLRRYSWKEAKETWIKMSVASLSEQNVEIFMKRGLVEVSDGKFVYSRDQRLKAIDYQSYSREQIRKLAENITCHFRLVKGSKSLFLDRSLEHGSDVLSIIEKKAKSYKFHVVDGKHHLHMDSPEKIVPLLVEVLSLDS